MHQMAVGHFDPPGVSDGSKDLGTVLVAWWLIPSDPTNLVVELCRQPRGGRRRSAAVYEDEFQPFVSTASSEVVKYLFDGVGLGRRGGDNAHTVRQTRDVHADDALGAVGSTVEATRVVKGGASIRGPSGEVRIGDHHRRPRFFAPESASRRHVQCSESPGPSSVPRPPTKLGPNSGPGTELLR